MAESTSELRWDPLERHWVLIAKDRSQRPFDFLPAPRRLVDRASTPCPFCLVIAGHGPQTRIAERRRVRLAVPNADHHPRVAWTGAEMASRERFTEDLVLALANRYPVLSIETPTTRRAVGPYAMMSGVGAHEVIVETTQHDQALADMPDEQRQQVLLMWRDRAEDLVRDRRIAHVQVFKNEGPRAGASLEHAHSQIVASPVRPSRVERLVENTRAHYLDTERCLVCDMLDFETQNDTRHRLVAAEGGFIAWCPYASARPFEVHLAPRRHAARFTLSDEDALQLSKLLGRVLRALGVALANADLNLVLDLAPSPDQIGRGHHGLSHLNEAWHWRLEVVPRLLPYGGFELGTGTLINPTTPEDAAAHLRMLIDGERAQNDESSP